MRGIAAFPYFIQRWFAYLLGLCFYIFARKRKHIICVNLELCFPELNPVQLKILVRKNLFETSMGIIESLNAWWDPSAKIKNRFTIIGLEHLQSALQQKRGVLLIGGHFTSLEMAGRMLAEHFKNIHPVYKPRHNRLFEAYTTHLYKRYYASLLPNKSLDLVLKNIKAGDICWYAPDQDFGKEATVFAPLFGVSTSCLVVPAVIAKITKAPVLTMYSTRNYDGSFNIEISPPLEKFPTDDRVTNATLLNKRLEEYIKRVPEQYLWLHRRFKTRPPGESSVY